MKMNEKKSYFTFNLNSKLYIYPFLLPFACVLIHIFQKIMYENAKPENSFKMLKYNVPLLFYYFLPKILSIIFIPIIKSNTKGENMKEQSLVTRRYHSIIKTQNKKKIFLLIFLISSLEVIYKIGDSLLLYLQKINKIHYLIEKRTGFIISVPLFSYLILNKKLYKHHIIALILALIGALVVIISRFFLGFSFINEYLFHILIILNSFLFSFSLVLIKYLMDKYFIKSPYELLLYDGIFCILNLLIFGLVQYIIVVNIIDEYYNNKINVKEENKKYFINNYIEIFTILKGQNLMFYVGFLVSLISSFSYFIFNILTLFYFSPYLNVLTDFLTPLYYNILNYIFLEKERSETLIRYLIDLVGYIIIIFAALILNEIIILNFFGLNENTYSNIAYRGTLDLIYKSNAGTEDTITDACSPNETDDEASSSYRS